jgi:DNA-binding HxlR family transcriptional regulator
VTTWGESLEPILVAMSDWGERYKRRLDACAANAADC